MLHKKISFSLYRFSLIFKVKAIHNWLFKSSVITKQNQYILTVREYTLELQ